MDPTSWASALPSSSRAALATAREPTSATTASAPPPGRVALPTACRSLDFRAIPAGRSVTLLPSPWIITVIVTILTRCRAPCHAGDVCRLSSLVSWFGYTTALSGPRRIKVRPGLSWFLTASWSRWKALGELIDPVFPGLYLFCFITLDCVHYPSTSSPLVSYGTGWRKDPTIDSRISTLMAYWTFGTGSFVWGNAPPFYTSWTSTYTDSGSRI